MSDLLPNSEGADRNGHDKPSQASDIGHWRELVTQLGAEIAGPLTAALERVHRLATTGRIERQDLRSLREELEGARQAAIIGQQLARFGSGRLRQAKERMHLTQTFAGILTHRAREIQSRGLQLVQDLKPVEVIADASLLFGLLNSVLDWALANAHGSVTLTVDVKPRPALGRLRCAFSSSENPEHHDAEGSPAATERLDSLTWRLIEQIGWTMGLLVERSLAADECALEISFPQTVGHLEGLGAIDLDEGFAPASNSKPLAGSQVLVVAARREVRNHVREAIHTMGLIVDFVHSVAEATEFCRDGLPHAVIYEAALAHERFEELRASILAEVPHVAFIEIIEESSVVEMSGPAGGAPARIGREAIAASLQATLMFELSKAL